MTGFSKARKSESKGRVAISGPAGSGKTYTGLIWATALADGGQVATIDTERGSSQKYADLFNFEIQILRPPYHPEKLIQALADAEQAHFPALFVDSLTHFWSGPGGVLEIVDEAKARFRGNTHAAWQVGTPLQQKMVDALLAYPGHIIAAMRAKTEWLMQEGSNGKTQPVKIGLAPQQRDGIEYEFDVTLDVDLEHRASVSKTRFAAFADRTFPKAETEASAREFLKWLSEGEPLAPLDVQAAIDTARRGLAGDAKRELWGEWQANGLPADLSLLTVSQAATAQRLLEPYVKPPKVAAVPDGAA